jgi:hypothetical protein
VRFVDFTHPAGANQGDASYGPSEVPGASVKSDRKSDVEGSL